MQNQNVTNRTVHMVNLSLEPDTINAVGTDHNDDVEIIIRGIQGEKVVRLTYRDKIALFGDTDTRFRSGY